MIAVGMSTPSPTGSTSLGHNQSRGRDVIMGVLTAFLAICIFDPADRVFGAKAELFALSWLVAFGYMLATRARPAIPRGLLIYLLLFISIPVLALVNTAITSSSSVSVGLGLLKGYLLASFALLLVVLRADVLSRLSFLLTLLAAATIVVFVALMCTPEWFLVVHDFGRETGIILPDQRDYGHGFTVLQAYFVTSPMLSVSAAYYFGLAKATERAWRRNIYWLAVAVNLLGLVLAGSRNNMIAAILIPTLLIFIYATNKRAILMFYAIGFALAMVLLWPKLAVLLNPTEYSNSIKLSLFSDYARVFSDPWTVLFGKGLGTDEFWGAKDRWYFLSELTYLEMIRNFGALGALVMTGLLLTPIYHGLFRLDNGIDRATAIGFLVFLVMCFSNPNLFSSMGTLLLSVLLARLYQSERRNDLH